MLSRILIAVGMTLMFVSAGAADDSYANRVARQMGLQGRIIWFDAEANLWQLSSRTGVQETIAHCKAANINTIIVDVKPLCGLVLYNSMIAPKLTSWEGKPYPAGYDLLRTVIKEGHKAGIKVHAAVNVFSEGAAGIDGCQAFDHPDWQCVQYDVERYLVGSDGARMRLTCSNGPYQVGEICIYGLQSKNAGELPPNTSYLRITHDGDPISYGTATGRAHISAPEGGFLLLGTGDAGQWLKHVSDNKVRLHMEGNDRLVKIGASETEFNAVFVNPVREDVRDYELSVIREICRRYPVDGIVLDRMRYPNIYSDFSDESRKAFEDFLGRKLDRWPDDVFKRNPIPGDDVIRGPYFKDWVKFRATVMRNFLADAKEVINETRRGTKIGIYVGSWYPLYYDVGVNWGSPKHSAQHEWWPDGYEETGYADLVDYIMTGCYYVHPTRADAKAAGDEEWKSVEAATEESIDAVGDATFVYGSLYLYQYNTRPDKFLAAMKQCLDNTQGCMLFDLVYLRKYDWWLYLDSVFATPTKAPHDVPGLLDELREHEK